MKTIRRTIKLHWKEIILLILFFMFIWWLTNVIASNWLTAFVDRLGVFGPLGVIAYVVISHIFAPIIGSPGIMMSVGVYGIFATMLYTYIGGLISATIAFYISRKWGRGVVVKLVGEKTMQQVDNFVEMFGGRMLIISRIFGFPIFEVISYAAGLTNMSYKRYIVITILFSAIPNFTVNYIFRYADFSSIQSIFLVMVVMVTIGGAFIFFMQKYLQYAAPESRK